MKKTLFVLCAVLWTSFSQAQVADVYDAADLTWFGLDFTQSKMIGDFGTDGDPETIRDQYFKSWNTLMQNEKEKYDLKKFFHKQNVEYSLEKVKERNKNVDASQLMLAAGSKTPQLSLAQLEEITKEYANADKKGLGAYMLIESFDKSAQLGTIDVIFFDIPTGKVYMAKRFSKEPGGFGLRNYWAKTVYLTLEEVADKWGAWKKEEMKKAPKK